MVKYIIFWEYCPENVDKILEKSRSNEKGAGEILHNPISPTPYGLL